MGSLQIVADNSKNAHDPFATAFKDNQFTNYKLQARRMRSDGWGCDFIKERTGVDYGTPKKVLSPLDPNFRDTRTREEKADSQDMRDQRDSRKGRRNG